MAKIMGGGVAGRSALQVALAVVCLGLSGLTPAFAASSPLHIPAGANQLPGLRGPAQRRMTATMESFEIEKITVDNVDDMHAPFGWNCSADEYNDGAICHCECGVWDPDCDLQSFTSLPIINYGDDLPLEVLDLVQATTIIQLHDLDGNNNGVIDEDEEESNFFLLYPRHLGIGDSSLPGLATRILSAQQRDSGVSGDRRLGDFAWLEGTATAGCGPLLDSSGYRRLLSEELATYQPVCIKDSQFHLLRGQATGRCAWQPTLKPGAQCAVMDGHTTSVSVEAEASTTNDTNVTEGAENLTADTTIFDVCGAAAASRMNSNGFGVTTAKLWSEGRDSFVRGDPALGPMQIGFQNAAETFSEKTWSKDGFSFYVEITASDFFNTPRIFEVSGTTPVVWEFKKDVGTQVTSFIYASIGSSDSFRSRAETGDLTFYYMVHVKSHSTGIYDFSLTIPNAITRNQHHRLLFTVGSDWIMKVYKDAELLGIKQVESEPRFRVPEQIWVGTLLHPYVHEPHKNQWDFQGKMENIRLWDHEVTWAEAAFGSLPGQAVADLVAEETSLAMPCIASARNSWELYCNTILPDRLASSYGLPKVVAEASKAAFDSRISDGSLASCGASHHVRATLSDWTLGNGITRESYAIQIVSGIETTASDVVGVHKCSPWMPDVLEKTPVSVDVVPNISYYEDGQGPILFRYVGKLLVNLPGEYMFRMTRVNGGAWFGLDGYAVLQMEEGDEAIGSCSDLDDIRLHGPGIVKMTATTFLSAGTHDIEVLYYNRKNYKGILDLEYQGLDTSYTMKHINQDHLLSDGASSNSTAEVQVLDGFALYDEALDMAVMAAGSCGKECAAGLQKEAALGFPIYCSEDSTIGATAVFAGSERVTYWINERPAKVWDMAEQGTSSGMAARTSTSVELTLQAGENTLRIQGRPTAFTAFGLRSLSLAEGSGSCFFYTPGTKKDLC